MKNESKILIGCPTYDGQYYTLDKFLEAINKIDYKNFHLFVVENSEKNDNYFNHIKNKGIDIIKLKVTGPGRVRIAKSRELLREKALKQGYDYLLCLDQDIIVPPNIIKKLIKVIKYPILFKLFLYCL